MNFYSFFLCYAGCADDCMDAGAIADERCASITHQQERDYNIALLFDALSASAHPMNAINNQLTAA